LLKAIFFINWQKISIYTISVTLFLNLIGVLFQTEILTINKMKSKLISVLTLAFLLPILGIAQQRESPCNLLPYQIFKPDPHTTPVVLKRLGTSPQFGEIPKHTGVSAYNHLKVVHKNNKKGSRKEIDDLLMALGFSGFNDPSFSSKNLIPETLPVGTKGWMGAYGHKYAWSTLGNEFPTFKIYAKNGECFLYIMKKCGNAFFIPPPLLPPLCPDGQSLCPCPEGYRCTPAGCCEKIPTVCKTQPITISGTGQVQSGDVINTSKTMEIIAVNTSSKGTKGLLLGSYPVAVRSTYDFNVKGEAQYSKNIDVCVDANTTPAPMNLVLPMNLNYTITKNEVNVGDGEKVYLNVDDAQFAALSKAYKAVNVATTATPNMEAVTKKVLSNTVTESATMAYAGGTNCIGADQKVNFSGKTQIQDGSVKSSTNDVTIIGVYKKTGKLDKGEMPDKYLCLGNFQVPVKSAYEFTTSGGSDVSKILRVCTKDGVALADQNLNIPVKMTYSFTKQDVMLGDYNKLYISLTEQQYNSLSKSYNRCCTKGGEGKACK
jgi:hypothetical protein